MSLLIKGMEMPKEAGKYRIEFDQCGNPYLLSDNCDGGLWHIISIPPHGRLIDADKLKVDNPRHMNVDVPYVTEVTVEEIIDNAPTIIPAEE